jgi:hypothetical protein
MPSLFVLAKETSRTSNDNVGEIAKVLSDTISSEIPDVSVHDASGMLGGKDLASPAVDLAGCDGAVAGRAARPCGPCEGEALAPAACGAAFRCHE